MPRILYICSSWPLGKSFGGQIRALQVGRALQQVGDVDLLMVGSDAIDQDAREKTEREFSTLHPIAPILTRSRRLRDKLRRAFDTRYLDIHGLGCTPADRARIDAIIGQYDLIWLLNYRTPNLIQRWSWPNSHLDIDDLPSTYLRSMARNGPTFAQRLKSSVQHRLMRRRELRLGERFESLSVCSNEDKVYLGDERIHIIPNGFERPTISPRRIIRPELPRLGFIGLYSYAPNLEGMRWFLRESWPIIRREVPSVRLRLIGRDTDGPLKPTECDVDALGWVRDPSSEIATWSAMIVPILFGGGTRIKIAEAFSRKCPAVSTRVGAYGYQVTHGKHLLLADSGRDFAAGCISLLRDPEAGIRLAETAWAEYLLNWTWDAIGARVALAAKAVLNRNDRAPNA